MTGAVEVTIRWRDDRIETVRVATHRPRLAPLLAGRSAEEAATLIETLHAICRRAQGAAARAALHAARARPEAADRPAAAVDPAVRAEAAAELVIAALADDAPAQLAATHRAAHEPPALARLLERELLGEPIDRWLAITHPTGLSDWAARTDAPLARAYRRRLARWEPATAPIATVPAVTARDTLDRWPRIDAGFAAAPHDRGEPAETGPVARLERRALIAALAPRPLLQRWIARVTELALHARDDPEFRCGTVSVHGAAGRGRAVVETARGTLIHDVALEGGTVREYSIVAPTEWNFHPDGPLRHWLVGASARSRDLARDHARRAVAALDPCVECRFTVD
ncbi:MAG: nickel-dependent hydrogenase large subunit [Gammaproteobacteria bacterium]|nr:nickel-dependent hydrogenase large subunit [Gammaproteobacteria bacterium]